MEYFYKSIIKKEVQKQYKDILEKIKSKLIVKSIFLNLKQNKVMKIIKYNKKLQKKLNLNPKEYSAVKIEIIPVENKYGKFFNILNKEEESLFHIYFEDKNEIIKRNYIKENEQVKNIKIFIYYKLKSFNGLFQNCEIIKSIKFTYFYDKYPFIDIGHLFAGCTSLIKLDISILNTENVKNMSYMFSGCSSLEEINLSNFNTANVKDLSYMFSGCSSLKELDISNFDTKNIINMSFMLNGCSSLKKLKLKAITS